MHIMSKSEPTFHPSRREFEQQVAIAAASTAIVPLDLLAADPTTSPPEPSALVKASRFLSELWKSGVIPHEELERRALGAERLRETFSSIPFYAQRAAEDPDYWNLLYTSRVNT